MATGSLYGSVSESTGLYGIGAASGGTYFEWFIFQDSATAPATPTGGSWSFTTNTGTAPTGWVASPPASPVNQVWVSLAIVDSRSTSALTWTTPGLMSSFGNSVANYLTFVATSAPAYSAGRLWYDTNQKSFAYYNDVTNNVVHIGQETQLKVYNNTGSTITRGTPVYISSTSSGFNYPLVALAKADNQVTGSAIGLVNQDIPTATAGYVTTAGLITGNTGSFAVGDTLYVSPYSAGQLMNTVPPTGYAIKIGIVAYSNTPNGTIYVSQTNAYVTAAQIVGTVAIANGGTGATTASAARTALGLGTIATQDANNVAITGGSISLTTALPIASGGTGAITAAAARTNLSAVGVTDTQTLTNKTISGASNTLTNIGNSSLSNSTVTVNGSAIALGGAATITASTPQNLVFGSGLSASGNFNGSTATTVTLANTGTAGTYGDSGTIPVITTNAFGQISSVSLQSVTIDSTDITGTIAIAQGGTGAGTASAALVNLLPSYSGNAGKVLALNAGGSNVEWRATSGTGTVSSVAVSGGTTGLTTSGGPITAAGTITLAGTLATANGGTGLTSFTANGVVYASSTSALATGTALTFDGTNLINIQNTASPIGLRLRNTSTSTSAGTRVSFEYGGSITGYVGNQFDGSDFNNQYQANRHHIWINSSSETMRLTSTGLGIGTSSPNLLSWNSALTLNIASGNIATEYAIAGVTQGYVSTDTSNFILGSYQSIPMLFRTGNTTRMTLDASGNLGLGVTPSAWATGYNAFQFGASTRASAIFTNGVNDLWQVSNNYFNGTNFLYNYTGSATAYNQTNGAHNWRTAASGVANSTTITTGVVYVVAALGSSTLAQWQAFFSALTVLPTVGQTITATATGTLLGGGTVTQTITFTQAMTLNASGNLGIGTTAPSVKLSFGTSLVSNAGYANAIRVYDSGEASTSVTSNSYGMGFVNSVQLALTAGTGGNIGLYTANTERMRIDASGNLGIGTSSPVNKLVVSNGGANGIEINPTNGNLNAYNRSTSAYTALTLSGLSMILQTGASPADRVTIDSAGNLGIGTPSPATILNVVGGALATTGTGILAAGGLTSGRLVSDGVKTTINPIHTYNDDRAYEISAGSTSGYVTGVVIGARSFTGTGGEGVSLWTRNTERMRIDSVGNLGVGVTPSAWGSAYKAFDISAYGCFAATTVDVQVVGNAYYNGTNWVAKATGAATRYIQLAGVHYFQNAASVAAGATPSFSNAMTLDASGNLGIGTSSPAVKLDIAGTMRSSSVTITGAAGGNITATSDTTNQYTITALGAAATFLAPSGTPIDGQKLTIRIKDNATARALTWTTGSTGSFRAIGTTLPTTTVASKTIYVGCIYNSADSRWDVIAVGQEA